MIGEQGWPRLVRLVVPLLPVVVLAAGCAGGPRVCPAIGATGGIRVRVGEYLAAHPDVRRVEACALNRCVVRTREQLPDGLLFLGLPAIAAGPVDLRVTAQGAAGQLATVRGQVVLERRNVGTRQCPLPVVTASATWTDRGAIAS